MTKLYGGAGEDRTHAWGICSPLPYYLATAPVTQRIATYSPEAMLLLRFALWISKNDRLKNALDLFFGTRGNRDGR